MGGSFHRISGAERALSDEAPRAARLTPVNTRRLLPPWIGLGARLRRAAPLLTVLFGSIAFRAPVLLNAGAVNSDAAVVGLQAMHMLRGEWSFLLWGTGYQLSIDSVMAAIGFAIAGPRPITLATVPLVAHLIFCWLAWDLLRRRIGRWGAAVATLPLVVSPMAVNIAFIYVARQWSIVFVFLSIWLWDQASTSRRPLLRYAAGSVALFCALSMDLFTLQFSVGLAALAILCCLDGAPRAWQAASRLVSVTAGAVVGWWIFQWVRSKQGDFGAAQLSLDRIKPNFELMIETCLPWTLSAKVFANFKSINTEEWHPGKAFELVQELGALVLILGILFGRLAFEFRRIPWRVRRLGVVSFIVVACSIGGFLVSTMPQDAWSCRYLSPIIYMTPFALAPLGYVLRRRLFWVLSPYVVSAAVGGWVSYGNIVHGALPTRSRAGAAREEAELAHALRERGVHYAAAEYWLSYRLTLLTLEDPIVVPLNEAKDRYQPYRYGFSQAAKVAYIFHPEEPRATPEGEQAELTASSTPFQREDIAGFTVFIVDRSRPAH